MMGAVTQGFMSLAWPEIQEAAKHLDEGMNEDEKAKQIAKLNKQIAELKAALEPLQPSWRYMITRGQIFADAWREFTLHWRQLQGRLSAPCSPAGVILDRSSQEEQDAWKGLIGKERINKHGLKPHPGVNRSSQEEQDAWKGLIGKERINKHGLKPHPGVKTISA